MDSEYDLLSSMIDEGRVSVMIDETTLNRPGSPAFSATDNNLLVWGCIVGALSGLFWLGIWVALGLSIVWAVVFLIGGKHYVLRRVNGRTMDMVTASSEWLDLLLDAGYIQLIFPESIRIRRSEDWRPIIQKIHATS